MASFTRTGGIGAALLLTLVISSPASAQLAFAPPQFLPGDATIAPAAGMQEEADIALGDTQFLVVWSDGRTTPDDFYPFATEGSGMDIYAARLDAAGNVLDTGPIVVTQALGDQIEPRVAWNGQNWLVIWEQDNVALPTYEEIRAARVAPDGTVLDSTPLLLLDNQSFYDDTIVEGGNGEWVVVSQVNGPLDGLLAVRVAGNGAVMNPGGLQVLNTLFMVGFDVAFAQDEYLIVWHGAFDPPRGARYATDLTLLGTSVLPFGDRVASDGLDFLVTSPASSPPQSRIDAVQVAHDGTVGSSFNLVTGSSQSGLCCANVTWDGTVYFVTWGQTSFARVTPTGQVLDPGGLQMTLPASYPMSTPLFAGASGGGLQLAWNDGVSGAVYPKDVHSARLSPGLQLENETPVSRGAPAQLDVDLARGAGVHLAVFQSRGTDTGRILAQRLDDAGAALDAEPIEVASGPLPGDGLPTLGNPAAAWNGSLFLVTWSDGISIFGRRMLADGTFVDAVPLTVMDGFDPDVAAVGSVFLVVGIDFLQDNPQWQATHSMRVDGATGANLDAAPNALGGFAIFAQYPHVVGWGSRWLAVWQRNLSHDNPAAGTTIALVDADGTTPGIVDLPLGWRPDVAVSGDRALFVAVTNTVASATTDLQGQIMMADETLGATFVISAAAGKQLRPAATWNGTEFIAAWEDKRGAVIYFDQRTDIYGTRIAPDGTVLDPAGVALADADAPEVRPVMMSVNGNSLLGVSAFRPEPAFGAYRIGILTDGGATTGVADAAAGGIRLLGASPNPTRSSTTLRFTAPPGVPVRLRIYDAAGRLVRTLMDGSVPVASGAQVQVGWDGRDDTGRPVASGVYFYGVGSGKRSAAGRVVVLR